MIQEELRLADPTATEAQAQAAFDFFFSLFPSLPLHSLPNKVSIKS